MVVRQHVLRLLIGFVALAFTSSCIDDDLEEVRDVRIATHVDDWRDEVIYQLLVDRFANGSAGNDHDVDPNPVALAAYKGGDWQGVIDRLDYLEALGVTAIWISPVVRNVETDAGVDGYHGYWAVDLERVNPHFGDLATLRRMVAKAHERGIKVILDIVTNHLGQVFYYDINMNGQPDENVFGGHPLEPGNPQGGSRTPVTRVTEYDPDYDPRGVQAFTSLGEAGPAPVVFFDLPSLFRVPPSPAIFTRDYAYNRRGRVSDWNDREQVVYGDFPGGLKDVRTEDPEVREEMVRVYVDWVLKADLDGFRIDTVKHVEHEFWQFFAAEVRARLAAAGKEQFLMFGEAFDGDDALVGSYTRPGELDSVFYFPQKFQVFDEVFGRGGPTSKIAALFDARAENYGAEPQPGGIGISPQRALINFMDNHDVPRFLWSFPDVDGLRAALAFLLTWDGIPCLYYGTEQEFRGGNDPANREPLWESGYATGGETFRWIASLIALRKRYPALRRGDTTLRWTTDRTGDEADAGIVAFERRTDDEYALVVVNAQGAHASRTSFEGQPMALGVTDVTLVDALTEERHGITSDGTLDVEVPPHGVKVLVPEDQYAR